MKQKPIDTVLTAGQAQEEAIEWQTSFDGADYDTSELIEWQSYFETLAEKFPELTDEFKENGII